MWRTDSNTVLTKLCLCGEDALPGKYHCADCKPERTNRSSAPSHPYLATHRWKSLSLRLRKASPFCELCGSTTNLCVDHIIPASEDPSLIFVKENLRVLCRLCNTRKKDSCTDAERQRVLEAIAARKRRRTAI